MVGRNAIWVKSTPSPIRELSHRVIMPLPGAFIVGDDSRPPLGKDGKDHPATEFCCMPRSKEFYIML